MLHFNELKISQDNKFLIIDVSVDHQDYFKDVLLDSIIIDTNETYAHNGPSNNPIFTYTVENMYDLTYSLSDTCNCNPIMISTDESYCFTYGTQKLKNVRLELNIQDLNVSPCKTMFFVYVKSKGTVSVDTPCGFYEDQIIGTVVNLQAIYSKTMLYIKQIERNCDIPKDFIDMILKLRSIELCIKTGNYIQAIKYWNKFFLNLDCDSLSYNCNCYG